MTLMYEMQLMDELPMVWGAAYMYYCLEKVCQVSCDDSHLYIPHRTTFEKCAIGRYLLYCYVVFQAVSQEGFFKVE